MSDPNDRKFDVDEKKVSFWALIHLLALLKVIKAEDILSTLTPDSVVLFDPGGRCIEVMLARKERKRQVKRL